MSQDIWNDDQLGRAQEAKALERFLIRETEGLIEAGLDHAYVLGIDSPYGVGKTWFLNKLKDQLAAHNYPVAFVDAWADDAGDEPMVAIMAAVEDALKPYWKRPKITDNLVGAVSSLGTILAKGGKGVIVKGAAKYLGEEASEGISETLREAVAASVEGGVESTADAVGEAIDGLARKAIDAYQKRKRSVSRFKSQLLALHNALSDERSIPIFIVVDELDRCRPTYAIKLLEELKHLFDVRGLVFIIALHGRQLEKALGSVYGPSFDGSDYLRRFFTSKYKLYEPSMIQLSDHLFYRFSIDRSKLMHPLVLNNGEWSSNCPEIATAKFFESAEISSRGAFSIMRGLRIFVEQWEYDYPFELIPVLAAIWSSIATEDPPTLAPLIKHRPSIFAAEGRQHSEQERFSAYQLCSEISNRRPIELFEYSQKKWSL